MNMDYAFSVKVSLPFVEALARVKDALAAQGFGVLTEINVKETMKKKLGVAYADYVILGACNPPLAHEALHAEKSVGLFLPCNVIVYEDGGDVFASALRPTSAMSMIRNDALAAVAAKAEEKLKRVVDSLGA